MGGQVRVFVYGTLLRGERNHHLIAGGHYLGPASTDPCFELLDLGSYPAMVAGGTTAIRGEVFEVDEAILRSLDDLEGYPGYYQREDVTLADGRRCLAYLLPASYRRLYPLIPGGDWRRHRAR